MLKNLIYICLGLGFLFLLLLLLIKPFREFVLKIYKQYKEIINYVVVGGLTTAIAIGTLYIFNSLLNIRVEIANVLSWICAVIFAFVFNKLFVFESKGKDLKTVSREFTSFVGARLASLAVDETIMIIGCNIFHGNTYVVKIISEVFVVIMNYFFSKFIIFKKK